MIEKAPASQAWPEGVKGSEFHFIIVNYYEKIIIFVSLSFQRNSLKIINVLFSLIEN